MILSMKYFFIAAIFLFHFSDCIAEETGDPAKIPVVANKVRGLTAGDAADDYFAGKMKKCADEWKKVKNPDPDALGMFEGLDCVEACHPQNGRTPHEKGLFEEKFKQCSEKESGAYKCGNIALCRSHVTYLHSDCRKKNASDPSCGDQARKLCYDACSLPSDNNCIPADAKNFEDGRALCASNPGRQLIGDREANQIIQQRAQEIYSGDITQPRPPTSELAKSSIFYSGNPSPDAKGGGSGTTQTASTTGGESNTATNGSGTAGQQAAMTPAGTSGGSSGSSGGVAPAAFNAGGSSGGSSSGGGSAFQDSSRQDSRGSNALDAVGNSALSSDNFSGAQWPDAPAAKNYGGGGSSGGSSSGGGSGSALSGGGLRGGQSPGGIQTASVRGRGQLGSVESAAFQSGFHKASGGKPLSMSPKSKKALANFTKNKKRTKSDGAMNLSRLLGGKNNSNRGIAANKNFGTNGFSRSADIGSGPHPVFTTVDTYFEKLRLDVNGEIDL